MLLRVVINTKSVAKSDKFESELEDKKVNYRRKLVSWYPTYILWLDDQRIKLPYNSYISQASYVDW